MSEVENHVIDLLPAFVLDALTDDETNQVTEHLASCSSCQAEFVSMQQVADELPLALTQTSAPPAVKDRLMERVRSSQNLPGTIPATYWQRLALFFRRTAPALSLALIAILALVNITLWQRLSQANTIPATAMRVIALAHTENSPQAEGSLVMDPHGIYGTLVVDSMADLGANQQYQVWLIKGTERTSGGVFSVNPEGYASLEITSPLPLRQYDAIGITIEPAGGSPGPTGAKVLGGNLPPP